MSRVLWWFVLGVMCLAFWIVIGWFVWSTQVGAVDCEPEPASPWAPAGWICPPAYGDGIASQWPGPGVARNDCVWPWTACAPIRITAETGVSVIVTPTMWCHCWVGVTGPVGETARIVDLDPATVAALGLDPGRGLHRVRVETVGAATLPDTAMP